MYVCLSVCLSADDFARLSPKVCVCLRLILAAVSTNFGGIAADLLG